jgi:hypothetical protein
VKAMAGDDAAEQVKTAFRIALSREPAPAELNGSLEFLNKSALVDLCHVVLNLNEFVYVQ